MSAFAPTNLRRYGLRTLICLVAITAAAFAGWSVFANPPVLQSIAVAEIYYHPDPPSCPAGAVRQFTATGTYSDGSQQYLTTQVAWSSSDTTVATITNLGLSSCVASGTSTISATLTGVVGNASFTVSPNTTTAVVISPSTFTLQTGTTQQYNATAEFAAEVTKDVTSVARWSSSNTAVATVSSTGLVTAVAPGTATLQAGYPNRSGQTTVTVSNTVTNQGIWGPPQSWGMTPINLAVLNTGKVLLWAYPLGRNGGPSAGRLWDPIANAYIDATLPFPIDIFCSGQSILADGRVMVAGGLQDQTAPGDVGTFNTTIYNPATGIWTQGNPMAYARWYPTTIPMQNGTVLVAAGTAQDGVTTQVVMETYNPKTNTWAALPSSANMPTPVADYPMLAILPGGNMFWGGPRGVVGGGDNETELYNITTQTWSYVSTYNWGPRAHSGWAMLPKSEKIMVASGGYNTQIHPLPVTTTEIIDFSQPNPQWVYGPSMNIGRYYTNLIYMADGNLIAVGGNQNYHYGDPVEQPEIFDPVANTWTLMPPQLGDRGYHSVAALLPDGRILSTGSDSGIGLMDTYEIYSPAYLFNGTRPVITTPPTSVQFGSQFTFPITAAHPIARVALIPPGATTHGVQMQAAEYIDMMFTAGAKQVTATAPSSSAGHPPGYYELVIVDSNGVPSVMPFVYLHAAGQ